MNLAKQVALGAAPILGLALVPVVDFGKFSGLAYMAVLIVAGAGAAVFLKKQNHPALRGLLYADIFLVVAVTVLLIVFVGFTVNPT